MEDRSLGETRRLRSEEMLVKALGIPVLLKAIDFLFEEGSKVLQERRERRETNAAEPQDDSIQDRARQIQGQRDDFVIRSKEAALDAEVNRAAWSDLEDEVQHLLSLLEIHTHNYYLAKEQYARWGSALVPPIVANNLTEAEDQIADIVRKLESLLNKVFQHEIAVPDLESS